jgi:hypothetical protein
MLTRTATIYVLWHPGFGVGRQLATAIFNWFRLPSGFGIPVFYRSKPSGGRISGQPLEIPLLQSELNLLVVLADEQMVADDKWRDWLVELATAAEADPKRTILYPVAFHPTAYKLPAEIRRLNFISPLSSAGRGAKLEAGTPTTIETRLLKWLTEACARVLVRRDDTKSLRQADAEPPKIKIFISHAKADGTDQARAIRDYILQETQLSTFYDENDIALGYKFSRVLEDTLLFEAAALIAIQGDRYADRPWCRREIQLFRKPAHLGPERSDVWQLHPVLLVDAMKGNEISRSIPELGNSPAIRWQDGDEHRYIDALLRDTILRSYHRRAAMRLLPIPGRAIVNWTPDPLSIYEVVRQVSSLDEIIYPDGGLSGMDLDALRELFPQLTFRTFNEAQP